jgi:hypothetical protein
MILPCNLPNTLAAAMPIYTTLAVVSATPLLCCTTVLSLSSAAPAESYACAAEAFSCTAYAPRNSQTTAPTNASWKPNEKPQHSRACRQSYLSTLLERGEGGRLGKHDGGGCIIEWIEDRISCIARLQTP